MLAAAGVVPAAVSPLLDAARRHGDAAAQHPCRSRADA